MYQSAKVKDCTRELIGFRQPMSDCYANLNNTLNNSISGMYFEDFHAINSTDYLRMIAPDFNVVQDSWLPINLPPVWNIGTSYNVNDIVTTDGTVTFISLRSSNLGNDPIILSDAWRVYEYKPTFENWLLTQRDAAVATAVNKVFRAKKLEKYTKSLFQDSHVFRGIGSYRDTEPNTSRFVGWRLQLSQHENLRLTLHKLGLQFSTAQPSLTVYVYHPSVQNPIYTQTFSTSSPLVFEWKQLADWLVYYASNDYDTGMPFYIGYYQDDITTGNAINKVVPRGCILTAPCNTCGYKYEFDLFNRRKTWFSMQSFYVNPADLAPGRTMFDLGDNESNLHLVTNKTYGLNFVVSVQCDLSDFLCRHTDLFVRAVGMQFTANMLNAADASLRVNQGETRFIDLVAGEYEKMKDSLPNAFTELEKEIESLDFDLSDLSSPCMPCQKKGFSLRAI